MTHGIGRGTLGTPWLFSLLPTHASLVNRHQLGNSNQLQLGSCSHPASREITEIQGLQPTPALRSPQRQVPRAHLHPLPSARHAEWSSQFLFFPSSCRSGDGGGAEAGGTPYLVPPWGTAHSNRAPSSPRGSLTCSHKEQTKESKASTQTCKHALPLTQLQTNSPPRYLPEEGECKHRGVFQKQVLPMQHT